jgi:hypothetical protein
VSKEQAAVVSVVVHDAQDEEMFQFQMDTVPAVGDTIVFWGEEVGPGYGRECRAVVEARTWRIRPRGEANVASHYVILSVKVLP